MIGAYKLTDLEAREGYLGIESRLEKSLAYLVSTKDKELIILMDHTFARDIFGHTAIVLSRKNLKQFLEELSGISQIYF